MRSLLERSVAEQSVDRLVENSVNMNVWIRFAILTSLSQFFSRSDNSLSVFRSGMDDIASHSWYSKRMHRMMSEIGASSTLDLVPRRAHWWDSTVHPGDGGIMNDEKMRQFYSHCHRHALFLASEKKIEMIHSSHRDAADRALQSGSVCSDGGGASGVCAVGKEAVLDSGSRPGGEPSRLSGAVADSGERQPAANFSAGQGNTTAGSAFKKCRNKFSLAVFNPSAHQGMCGFRVIQQSRSLDRSVVSVSASLLSRRSVIFAAIQEINMRKHAALVDVHDDFQIDDNELSSLDKNARSRDMTADWIRANSGQKQQGKTKANSGAGSDSKRAADALTEQKISEHPEMKELFSFPSDVDWAVLCVVRTVNLRRLLLKDVTLNACRNFVFNETLGGRESLTSNAHYPVILVVDGRLISINGSYSGRDQDPATASGPIIRRPVDIELCWDTDGADLGRSKAKSISAQPVVCSAAANPLFEKTLDAGVGIKSVYSKPLVIVYGTPANLNLRTALRDTAVYVANSVLSASGSTVKVFSDFEYREMLDSIDADRSSGSDVDPGDFSNHIFVGGAESNKVVKQLYDGVFRRGFIRAHFPIRFSAISKSSSPAFQIGPYRFDDQDEGVVFSFPMTRALLDTDRYVDRSSKRFGGASKRKTFTNKDTDISSLVVSAGFAVCISANSATAYLHASRIVWRDAARLPFAQSIPDFAVYSSKVWSHGWGGGGLLLGYWSQNWTFDESLSYLNPGQRLQNSY